MSTLELRTVSLTLIDPNPNNARRSLGDLSDLTASIKERGILQPPIVVNSQGDDGERYMTIAGHRRLAAAAKAGLTETQVLVRTGDTETDIQVSQLVENLQRKDLDPIEEAAGFMRAVGLGMTQKALSKAVGRSVSHVADRLRLLELPAPILAQVKKGDLPAAHALPLVDLDSKEDQLELAAEAIRRGYTGDLDRAVTRRIEEREGIEKQKARRAELTEANIQILDDRPAYDDKTKRRIGSEIFFKLAESSKRVSQDTIHRDEPCHAVHVGQSWGRVEESAYCIDPKRHSATGKSELKSIRGTGVGMNPEEKAKRAWSRDVQSQSKGFLGSYLRKMPANSEVISALADDVISRNYRQHTQKGLCEIFGFEHIPVPTKIGDKTRVTKDWATPLRKFMEADPKNRVKVAYALTFMGVQNNISDVEGLVRLGFEPPADPTKPTTPKKRRSKKIEEIADEVDAVVDQAVTDGAFEA